MKRLAGGCAMSVEMQTLSQKRAKHAWDWVARVDVKTIAKFADEAKKFPLRVRNAGLLQTLAYVSAKGKGEEIANVVQDWLKQEKVLAPGKELRQVLREGNAVDIRQLTRETMLYLEWLVRFSEARKKESK